MSDEDLFAEEMADVTPLRRDARVRLVKERLSQDQREGRQRAAEREEAVAMRLVSGIIGATTVGAASTAISGSEPS